MTADRCQLPSAAAASAYLPPHVKTAAIAVLIITHVHFTPCQQQPHPCQHAGISCCSSVSVMLSPDIHSPLLLLPPYSRHSQQTAPAAAALPRCSPGHELLGSVVRVVQRVPVCQPRQRRLRSASSERQRFAGEPRPGLLRLVHVRRVRVQLPVLPRRAPGVALAEPHPRLGQPHQLRAVSGGLLRAGAGLLRPLAVHRAGHGLLALLQRPPPGRPVWRHLPDPQAALHRRGDRP